MVGDGVLLVVGGVAVFGGVRSPVGSTVPVLMAVIGPVERYIIRTYTR